MASEIKVDTVSEKTSANGVTIDGVNIKDSKIVTANSVIEANMSANSVDSDSYVDGSIDTAHIADLNVTTGKIAADAITAAKIADNAVVTAGINADAVTGAKIADDAINSEHYTDGSIDTAHIADGQVTIGKLATAVLTGATDIGAAIADADLLLVDDGAGGTLRKTAASRIKTYIGSNTPAFHASGGANGSVANSTDVIIANDDELFDSDGCYDTGTYRFTPAVAGKYYLYSSVRWQVGTNAATRLDIAILKNGSNVLAARNNNSDYSTVNVSGIVDLDADDYVEERGSQNTGNAVAVSEEANLTFFGGFRIIGA